MKDSLDLQMQGFACIQISLQRKVTAQVLKVHGSFITENETVLVKPTVGRKQSVGVF